MCVLLCQRAGAFAAEAPRRKVKPTAVIGRLKKRPLRRPLHIAIQRPGQYLLEDSAQAMHGTWWVESDAVVEARPPLSAARNPLKQITPANYADAFAGQARGGFLQGDHPGMPGAITGTRRPIPMTMA